MGFDLSNLPLYEKWGPTGTTKASTTSISVSPVSKVFTYTGQTQQLTILNQDGVDKTASPYTTYLSNNTSVGTVTTGGLFTILKLSATTTVTATFSEPDDLPLSTTFTVVKPILTMTPTAQTYNAYQYSAFTITLVDQNNTNVLPYSTLTSSDTNVATVAANGQVTIVNTGSTTITANHYGVTASTTYTISGEVVSSITIDPTGGTHLTGTTFVVTIKDQKGNDITQYSEKAAGQEIYVTDFDETTGTVTLSDLDGTPSLSFRYALRNKVVDYEADIRTNLT
jgi:hypothetical protein